MDARVFRRVQRYGWDAATEAYDRGWVPQIERLTQQCVARARLNEGERVLDVATGTGVGAFAAAEAVGPGGSVTGIDVSARMVARAAERAQAIGARNVHFQRADMEATGAPDGGYHAVVCAFGLMFAADSARAFAEIARVTARGGRISVCVWGQRAACGFAEVFPIVDARVASDVCPLFFSLGVPGALSFALRRAGLEVTHEERVPVTLAWASADEVCDAMLEGGAVALAWKRFSPDVRAEVRAATRRRWSGSGTATVTTFRPRSPSPRRASADGTTRSAPGHASGVKARNEEAKNTNERYGHEHEDEVDAGWAGGAGARAGGTRGGDAGGGCAAAKADIQKTFGFVPQFLLKLPEGMLPGTWEELKSLQLNPQHGAAGAHEGADRAGASRRRSPAATASSRTPSSPS